jgi:hypothetical protein
MEIQETVYGRYNMNVTITYSVEATYFMRNEYEYFKHYGYAVVQIGTVESDFLLPVEILSLACYAVHHN